MNAKNFLSVLFIMAALMAQSQEITKERLIYNAVKQQMTSYPKSTLKDLYKSFFQDSFGPGHLINDTASAGNYLRRELLQCTKNNHALYEPTGYLGNYYRVNLTLLINKTIPYEIFFDAFVKSANHAPPMTLEEWKKEWSLIDKIICEMKLKLRHYQKDRKEIFLLLEQNQYVLHHSTRFKKTYYPHYRIIEKTIFEKSILPYIITSKQP